MNADTLDSGITRSQAREAQEANRVGLDSPSYHLVRYLLVHVVTCVYVYSSSHFVSSNARSQAREAREANRTGQDTPSFHLVRQLASACGNNCVYSSSHV